MVCCLMLAALLPATAEEKQASATAVSPEQDLALYQGYFGKKFPDVPPEDMANGVYSVSDELRRNWEAIEEFPPYEYTIDVGQQLWDTPFKNGKTYKDCFPQGPGVQHLYPKWDKEAGMVVTLALDINQCRKKNGEKPYGYKKGKIADLMSYIAYQSRGQIIDVKVPKDDPRALAAYQEGKEFYFARRGQLNFSCANCHFGAAGKELRADVLSPALGQATGWPVYRSKWGELGTLHRRYSGCNKQVRAKPFPAQSRQYRNLEYFHTHMSNGFALNGPAARK